MSRKKEDRSDWVAVESDVSGSASPKVNRAKSAYVFFQTAKSSEIKRDLEQSGQESDFAAVQRETAARWRDLTASQKSEYTDKATKDKARERKENDARDKEFEKQQAAKRAAQSESTDGMRERKPSQQAKEHKAVQHRELTKEQKAEKEARRKEKQEKLDIQAQQQKELDTEKSKAAEARLKYLLSQADIFSHFGVSKEKKQNSPTKSSSGGSTMPKSPSRRARQKGNGGEEDEDELLKDEDETQFDRLTETPPCIAFGKMRDYQVEGLNWLIQIGKLGINGILADGEPATVVFSVIVILTSFCSMPCYSSMLMR